MASRQRIEHIIRRTFGGFFDDDGFILSGHLAYLTLLALFPFSIFLVSLAADFGRSRAGYVAISQVLDSLPTAVSAALSGPIHQVIRHRPSGVLHLGLLVAVWTTASVIETVRIIIHKAYNIKAGRPFWHYRLQSFLLVVAATLFLLVGIALQFTVSGAGRAVADHMPSALRAAHALSLMRQLLAPVVLFLALIGLNRLLVPRSLRPFISWPGAAITAASWFVTATLLPIVLDHLANYDITYGSLAGVMITLLFFYVVGSAFVLGAQLNAAIKETYWPVT